MLTPAAPMSSAIKLRLIHHESLDSAERRDHEPHQEPVYLRRSRSQILLLICGDVCGILLWSVMLLYASLLWYSHGKREVDLSSGTFTATLLMEFARPLSTIFTILFAATTARFLKAFGMVLLRKGCSIRTLDRLFGSTTVGGTVLTNLTLGIPRSLTTYLMIIVLFCLWTLSPLASQAVLRIMSIQPETETRYMNRTYMNVSDWGALQGAGSDGSELVVAADTLINAALIAPMSTKNQSRDLWGNVKLPLLNAQETNTTNATNGQWQTVDHAGFATYSSLIGLPISMPIDGAPNANGTSSTMAVSSWYWNVDCFQQPWTMAPPDTNDNLTLWRQWHNNWTSQFVFNWTSTIYTGSSPIQIFVEDLDMNRTGIICHVQCNSEPSVVFCPGLPARTYGIILNDGGTAWYGMCTLETTYTETEIECGDNGCLASRVRKLEDPGLPPPEWNVLDICEQTTENYHPLGVFFTNLADAFQSQLSGDTGSNSLVGFLVDPANPFSYNYNLGGSNAPTLANRSVDTINQRLAQILNSYWMSNLAYNLTTGDWGDNFQKFTPNADNMFAAIAAPNASLLQSSLATVNDEFGVFTCNFGWLTAFTVSVLIALLTTISGLIVVLRGKGPILAMNVTTMVRDSPYVRLPSMTSTIDDSTRSRRIGHVRVRFGDVSPFHEVGHVAIAEEGGTIEVGQLREDRLYI